MIFLSSEVAGFHSIVHMHFSDGICVFGNSGIQIMNMRVLVSFMIIIAIRVINVGVTFLNNVFKFKFFSIKRLLVR